MSATTRRRHGFTLVELLVVIGIIAVLVSILLPALNRARAQAVTVQCAANMKQLAMALQLYTLDFKGYVPKPLFSIDPPETRSRYWYDYIAKYTGVPKSWYDGAPVPYMIDKRPFVGTVLYCPGRAIGQDDSKLSYGGNRLCHNYDETATGYTNNFEPRIGRFDLVKISKYRRPGDVLWISDQLGTGTSLTFSAITTVYSKQEILRVPELASVPNAYASGEVRHNAGKVANFCFMDGSIKTLRVDQLVNDYHIESYNSYFWRGRVFP